MMVSTSFISSAARKTLEGIPSSSQSSAVVLVPSGILGFGYEVTNFGTSQVSISGVPLWEDPRFPNAFRIGVIVAASGTERSEVPFTADSGLRFYSVAGDASKIRIRVPTE